MHAVAVENDDPITLEIISPVKNTESESFRRNIFENFPITYQMVVIKIYDKAVGGIACMNHAESLTGE